MSEIEKTLGKGVVKSTKPKRMFFKKIAKGIVAGLLVASIFISGAFMFGGCSKTPPTTEPPPVTQPETPPVTPPPEEVKDTTVAEFVADNQTKAIKFAQDNFKDLLSENKTILSENWSFHSDIDGKLTAVRLQYTYAGEDNQRFIEEAEYIFANPVDVDDILDDTLAENALVGIVQRTEIFSFNAKENFIEQDLSEALYEICKIEDGQKMFREIESQNPDKRAFEVAHIDANNRVVIYDVLVNRSEDKDEFLSNLYSSSKTSVSTKASYYLGNNQLNVANYKAEEFKPESVADLVENYSKQLHSVLNTYFFYDINNTCFGRMFDSSKLKETQWRILSNSDNEITGFKYMTKYDYNTIDDFLSIGTISLAQPIKVEDFTSENLDEIFTTACENATMTFDYSYGFAKAVQGTRDALVNKIFEVRGMGYDKPENAQRYFIEVGSHLHKDVGETREFKMMQVEGDKVTEFTIFIRECNSDEKYIEQLSSSENYAYSTTEHEIDLSGTKLDYKYIEPELELEDNEILY